MDDKSIGAAVASALDETGRTRNEIASAVHMDPSALSRSISGQRTFKSLELAWLADFVGTSVDRLIGRATLPFMAAARATSAADVHADEQLSEIARLMYERRRGLHQLKVGRASNLPDISGYPSDAAIADAIVAPLREAFGGHWVMGEVEELATSIEKAFGIDVWVRTLPDGIHGYSVHAEQDGVYGIIVNSDMPAQRIRFTIAHELAHLVLGDDTTNEPHRIEFGNSALSPTERRANEIAGRVLIPADRIPDKNSWTTAMIRSEAARFRVAPTVFATRVRAGKFVAELGTLAEAWVESTPGEQTYAAWQERNCVERPPRRLLHDLALSYVEGESTARPFAVVAGISDMVEARKRARALVAEQSAA